MRKTKRTFDAKRSLQQRIETAEKRVEKLKIQIAGFGPYHAPPHKLTELDDTERKILQWKKELVEFQNNSPLFRSTERLRRMARVFRDLIAPSDQASKRRKRAMIHRWYAKIGKVTIIGILGILFIISGYLVSLKGNNSFQPPSVQIPNNSAPLISPPSPFQTTPGIAPASTAIVPSPQQAAIVVTQLGIGVRHRTQPTMDDPGDYGPKEGETVYLLESVTNAKGELWWKVLEQDGRTGYILAQFLHAK